MERQLDSPGHSGRSSQFLLQHQTLSLEFNNGSSIFLSLHVPKSVFSRSREIIILKVGALRPIALFTSHPHLQGYIRSILRNGQSWREQKPVDSQCYADSDSDSDADSGDCDGNAGVKVLFGGEQSSVPDNCSAHPLHQPDGIDQFKSAVCLSNGLGVEVDLAEPAKSYKLSADANDAEAQYNFGARLEHGDGVGVDLVEAAKYYKLSADQN
jgi:hypothetical protein